MKRIIAGVVVLSAGVTLADLTPPMLPSVKEGSVKMTQDAATGVVSVEYEIEDMPGIATFDVLTNGVSIGDAAISCLVGDINREVTVDKHTFTWRPEKSFPGHLFTEGNVKAVVKVWPTNDPPDYIVFDLEGGCDVRYFTSEAALPDGGLSNVVYRNRRLVMRKIPSALATYKMGSPSGEIGREPNKCKETLHSVSLSDDFYIGVFELTVNQYALLMNGDSTKEDDITANEGKPKVAITYETLRGTAKWWPKDKHEVDEGAAFATMRARFGGRFLFDLPTEAQWEFACRAGCQSAFYNGGGVVKWDETTNEMLGKIAWYCGNANTAPKPVGQLDANAFGLYDMLGNAAEMCLDQSQSSGDVADLGSAAVEDPVGYADAQTGYCISRSGSSWGVSRFIRSAYRESTSKSTNETNYIGLRLCFAVPR